MAISLGNHRETVPWQTPELQRQADVVKPALPEKRRYARPVLTRRGVLASVAGSLVWSESGDQSQSP